MAENIDIIEYRELLSDIKKRIQSAQVKAFRSVNRELISLYWDIGKAIVEKIEDKRWGGGVVDNLAKDLQAGFPGVTGFSSANLWRMRLFYKTYSKDKKSKDKTIVEYALRASNKPIGVATYRIVARLPEEMEGELPGVKEVEKLFSR